MGFVNSALVYLMSSSSFSALSFSKSLSSFVKMAAVVGSHPTAYTEKWRNCLLSISQESGDIRPPSPYAYCLSLVIDDHQATFSSCRRELPGEE